MQEVREELALGTDIVCVPIHVLVCQTCGERYYDRKTMRHLEEVERQLREGNGRLREVGRVLMYG
ncbi:MAG: YgiT-type zinc finger protein [Gemmatimonadetes bacterium]|nr:YgiT-type zinc finger protein [Gemmatimonadota bacterium]